MSATARARALWPIALALGAGLGLATPAASLASEEALRLAHPELGRLPIHNFSPQEYGSSPQNWAIVQDHRGVLYIGNTDGLLEYDGVSWRLIKTPRRTAVRSLAKGADGRIYVGGQSELGYLEADESGDMVFVPLDPLLTEEERDFADIWWTWATPRGVFFQSQARLFLYADGELRSWAAPGPGSLLRSYSVGERLLLSDRELGLTELVGDEIVPVRGAEELHGKRLVFALPWDDDRRGQQFLMITDRNGWFLHDGEALHPFASAIDDELLRLPVYNGLVLEGELFALATLSHGVLVFDRLGRVVSRVGRDQGLRSEQVLSVAQDRQGDLWLGLGNGIARVGALSPVTHFTEEEGARGLITVLRRHQGVLYGASTEGLFRLAGQPPSLERVEGLQGPTWALLTVESGLLVGHNSGVYWHSDQGWRQVADIQPAMALHLDRSDPRRVWVGHNSGLSTLRWEGGEWRLEGQALETTSFVRSLAQDERGGLWLGTEQDGVVAIEPLPPGPLPAGAPEAAVRRFGTAEGLRSVNRTQLLHTSRGLLVHNEQEVLRFDEAVGRFVPAPGFSPLLDGDTPLRPFPLLAEGPDGGIWLSASHPVFDRRPGTARDDGRGGLTWVEAPVPPLYGRDLSAVLPEEDGVVWLAGDEGLVRFDSVLPRNLRAPFTALLRNVAQGEETALYRGARPAADVVPPRLAFGETALRFEYAATSFDRPEEVLFQVLLEGQDQDWSPWSRETYRDYINLREGSYRFRVRARNAYGHVGAEDHFAFVVLPPWYRTAWAYGLWVALALATVWLLVRWRVHSLHRDKLRLEGLVAERTRALAERTTQLETLNRIVRSINQQSDFDALLTTLLEEIQAVIEGADHVTVLTRRARDGPFVIRATTFPAPRGSFFLDHDEAEARYVRSAARLAEDVFLVRDTRDLPANERLAEGELAKSLLVLRVASGLPAQGYIVLANMRRADAFDEHEVSVLEGLREHLISAFEKFRGIEELLAARDAAERASRYKGDFLANISHEIRTPMNAIIGLARLGDTLETVAQARDSLRKVGNAGEILLGLVNDVLDLSRIEAGRLELERARFDLHARLERVRELFEQQAAEKGIALRLALAPDLPRHVVGDPLRLDQVLINLVGNAVKFTEEGWVEVAAARRPAAGDTLWLELTVADSGIGLETQRIEELFAPFGQAEAGTARRHGGSGLGLTIARQLVELMGGRIEVESEPGRGSTFRCHVPVGLGAPGKEVAPPARLAAAPELLRGLGVLVVEDNPINQEVACRILAAAGLRAEVASDGPEALAWLQRERFDAVLMDVHLPGIDGYQTTERIRDTPGLSELPILALTAQATSGYRERCLQAGMNEALTKPVEPDLLLATLATLVRRDGQREPAQAVSSSGRQGQAGPVAGVTAAPPATLNTAAALRRLRGDLALYRRLLEELAAESGGLAAHLRELLEGGHRAQAGQRLHGFRGLAANLGAEAVAMAAQRLESELARGGPVEQPLAGLEGELATACAAIAAAFPEGAEPAAGATATADLASALVELERKLALHDPTAEALWSALLPQLRGSSDDARVQRLDGEIRRLDFTGAVETVRRLLFDAGAHPGT